MLKVLDGRNVYSTKYETAIGYKSTHGVIPESEFEKANPMAG